MLFIRLKIRKEISSYYFEVFWQEGGFGVKIFAASLKSSIRRLLRWVEV
jgi:hypothetical protein